MNLKHYRRPALVFQSIGAVAGCAVWLSFSAGAQIPPNLINSLKSNVGSQVQSTIILGGDYGLSGGSYTLLNPDEGNIDIKISKFGGMGDIYPIRPLGDLGIGWQPQVQGSMGYLTGKKYYNAGTLQQGDVNEDKTFAIQFGGGARFWFNDQFSIAPTIMGMYGNTQNSYDAHSAFGKKNQALAKQLGLIDWNVDTWTIRPALNFQYQFTWRRTILTLSSDLTYYDTGDFSSTSSAVDADENSESWETKLDVDVPLGVELFGYELRTGGYFSRIQLYNGLKDGLNTDSISEVHGRLVLDFLNQLWKVQYIGIGYSYMWGDNFNGWSIGADIAFRF
jgi:hypothetical protein